MAQIDRHGRLILDLSPEAEAAYVELKRLMLKRPEGVDAPRQLGAAATGYCTGHACQQPDSRCAYPACQVWFHEEG